MLAEKNKDRRGCTTGYSSFGTTAGTTIARVVKERQLGQLFLPAEMSGTTVGQLVGQLNAGTTVMACCPGCTGCTSEYRNPPQKGKRTLMGTKASTGPSTTRRAPRSAREHLICTPPRASTCPQCKTKILVAHCYGEPVRLDCAHLNRRGEVIALISGIGTYQWGDTRDEKVRRRSPGMIAKEWPLIAWVHADHRCGFQWQPEHLEQRVQCAPLPYSGVVPPF
jgi:hypothetical protein